MSTAARTGRISPEEYLARERRAEFKSEYLDGHVYPLGGGIPGQADAMAGTSRAHSLIVHNLNRELGVQLRERPCEVHGPDLRVSTDRARHYAYPDVIVVCGEPRLLDDRMDTLLNPTVVVEVLSPSAEAYDRGRKFELYRRLESLREYVLVAQDRPHVERFTRRGDEWALAVFDGMDATLTLESIACAVPLAEIYAKVPLPPGAVEDG